MASSIRDSRPMRRARLTLLAFIISGSMFWDFFIIAGMFFFFILAYVWTSRIPHSVKVRFRA
jgi:hypothetical protein